MRAQRPALARFEEDVAGEDAHVTVTLTWDDADFVGESTGSAEPHARPRLIGEATLRAVERIANGRLTLDLAAVATTDLGASRVAIAQVTSDSSPTALVGSAVIHENNPSKATARAVLDAINRHLAQTL